MMCGSEAASMPHPLYKSQLPYGVYYRGLFKSTLPGENILLLSDLYRFQ